MAIYRVNNNILSYQDMPFRSYGIPVFPLSGLQNYWRFEDNANDAIGGVNGTTSSVSYPTGKNNKAVYLNGGYVQLLANGTGTFDKQSYTIAGWIKITYIAGYRIVWTYDYTSHSSPYYAQHIRIEGGGGGLTFGTNVATILPSTLKLPNNVWAHFACMVNQNDTMKIYINGALSDSKAHVGTITYYNQEVWLGRSNWMTTSATSIDELGFWTRALTSDEVLYLYNEGNGIYY